MSEQRGVTLAVAMSGPPIYESGTSVGRLTFPLNEKAAYKSLHIPCADQDFARRIQQILGITLTAAGEEKG